MRKQMQSENTIEENKKKDYGDLNEYVAANIKNSY